MFIAHMFIQASVAVSRLGEESNKAMLEIADKAAERGMPSLVWRFGQHRRLDMIAQWARLEGARVLVDGCGVGMYVKALTPYADRELVPRTACSTCCGG